MSDQSRRPIAKTYNSQSRNPSIHSIKSTFSREAHFKPEISRQPSSYWYFHILRVTPTEAQTERAMHLFLNLIEGKINQSVGYLDEAVMLLLERLYPFEAQRAYLYISLNCADTERKIIEENKARHRLPSHWFPDEYIESVQALDRNGHMEKWFLSSRSMVQSKEIDFLGNIASTLSDPLPRAEFEESRFIKNFPGDQKAFMSKLFEVQRKNPKKYDLPDENGGYSKRSWDIIYHLFSQ